MKLKPCPCHKKHKITWIKVNGKKVAVIKRSSARIVKKVK
jgi:hypothetical protein